MGLPSPLPVAPRAGRPEAETAGAWLLLLRGRRMAAWWIVAGEGGLMGGGGGVDDKDYNTQLFFQQFGDKAVKTVKAH